MPDDANPGSERLAPAVAVLALCDAACRRHLLSRDAATRLRRYARERAVATTAALRAWLPTAEGISPDLARRMVALLPAEGQAPFGTWTPLAHLADGGMGRVWLSSDPSGRLVVVKTIKPSGGDADAASERARRFEREARITRGLDHPNIVRCLDSGALVDGTLFLVLEYIPSGDLKELIGSKRGLSEPLSLAIVHQVVDALAEAHRVRVVHRDIKPSNIFVAADGKALLADFGIARSTAVERTALTLPGATLGSPHYMSPEQALGREADIRSDLYAVGAVLFYCLTGKPPFDGNAQDVMHLHCHVPAPDVRALTPRVSAHTAALVASCLAKKPEERPRDPLTLRGRLEEALSQLGVSLRQALEETRDGEPPRAPSSADESTHDVPALAGEETIIADLSGRDELQIDLHTASSSPLVTTTTSGSAVATAIRTLTASLLADRTPPQERDRTPVANELRASEPGSEGSAGSAGTPARAGTGTDQPLLEPLAGDLGQAIAQDWLCLAPDGQGDPTLVMLFARTRLVMGKLRDAPVDICLRNYPVATHKDALLRISRSHVELRYDRLQQQCLVEDLGGANGTLLDGAALAKGQPKALAGTAAHVLIAASAVSLWLRCRGSRRGGQRILLSGAQHDAQASCGLETDHANDAVVITRPENRPELAYAMVLRRVTIGGPGSDIALAGARSLAAAMIGRYGGRWVWRPAAEDEWRALTVGARLDCGGRQLLAAPGSYEQF